MSEDMIVGRKDIIEYLRVPMQLSMDHKSAWRKICRWKRDYRGFKELFLYLPTTKVYMIRGEADKWIKDYSFKRGSKGRVQGK